LCYIIMTTFYGICIAAEWGCEFAYIAFWHIWIISPLMKIFEMNCGICQRIYANIVNCTTKLFKLDKRINYTAIIYCLHKSVRINLCFVRLVGV
jgi:hypothetical protein